MNDDISLRPATQEDIDRMYQWRNDPDIYRWFRNQDEELEWSSHVEWFQTRPDDRHDLIIECRSKPVGVVAIASDGDIGIYIGEKDLWGNGIATAALSIAIDCVERELHAEIHTDNESSQKVFERVGFERGGSTDQWLQYEYNE